MLCLLRAFHNNCTTFTLLEYLIYTKLYVTAIFCASAYITRLHKSLCCTLYIKKFYDLYTAIAALDINGGRTAQLHLNVQYTVTYSASHCSWCRHASRNSCASSWLPFTYAGTKSTLTEYNVMPAIAVPNYSGLVHSCWSVKLIIIIDTANNTPHQPVTLRRPCYIATCNKYSSREQSGCDNAVSKHGIVIVYYLLRLRHMYRCNLVGTPLMAKASTHAKQSVQQHNAQSVIN